MKRLNAHNPRERLVYHVQELERLEREKQEAAEAFREALENAAAAGFDRSTLKVVLRLRKLTPSQRKERRALEAIYLAALGMLEGDPLPDEARRRLDEQDNPPPPADPQPRAEEDEASAPPPPPPSPQPLLVFKDPEEARQEGRDAAAAGKRIYDNPFPAGDPCRAAWDEGWCEQKKSHGMDTPTAYQRRSKPPEKSEKDAGDDKGADGKGEAA
jgi:uncharacterized protein (UPF0335 family)